MQKIILALALCGCALSASAQETAPDTVAVPQAAPSSPSTGDYFGGLTRPLTFDRMIPPYGMEVTYDKTVHVIFPSAVRYVDLGSPNLIAGKADGAENVIRVKATVKNFRTETNFSVITESGSFYTFSAPIIGS